jgi:hypothetical protein
MPSGIILSSGSQGATQEAIEKVLEAHGYEAEKPAVAEPELIEPKRDDFDSDDAFDQAKEEFDTKQEEGEQARAEREEEREDQEEEEQRKREQAAPTKKPTRRQRAVEKATKELREELRKSNERLAALEGKQTTRRTPTVEEPKQPKREDFKTDAEFEEATFDYRFLLRRAKEQAEETQKTLAVRQKETFENYQTQVAAFKEEHDDWDEVVNQKLPIHESVQLAIIELENGPQVTYYLGKHLQFTRDLAEMSPLAAVMEVGSLAKRLKTGAREPRASDAGTKKKTPPRLPEPVRPVSTSATSTTLSSREAAQKRDYKGFKAAQRRGV